MAKYSHCVSSQMKLVLSLPPPLRPPSPSWPSSLHSFRSPLQICKNPLHIRPLVNTSSTISRYTCIVGGLSSKELQYGLVCALLYSHTIFLTLADTTHKPKSIHFHLLCTCSKKVVTQSGGVTVGVERVNGTQLTATVQYATVELTESLTIGQLTLQPAQFGVHYTGTAGSLTFNTAVVSYHTLI